jgi:hypothetical protein
MILDWKYDVEARLASVDVVPGLRYETPDGGQTINKFVDGKLVDTFHKFGPDRKFKGFDLNGGAFGIPLDEIKDEWPAEVQWLAETYPDVVGPLLIGWDQGFLNSNGEIEGVGSRRGMGVISEENPVSINRICQPASVQEWWGWETVATNVNKQLDENCHLGIEWKRNLKTGEIVRIGHSQPQVPCCVFPQTHGPYPVTADDVLDHDGEFVGGWTYKKLLDAS